jgi:hypothetical protein
MGLKSKALSAELRKSENRSVHLIAPHVHDLRPLVDLRGNHGVGVQGGELGALGLGTDAPKEAPLGVVIRWAQCEWLVVRPIRTDPRTVVLQ